MNDPTVPLDGASEEIKLAVDLIYLLETNQIEPHTALEALKIVQQDLLRKIEEAAKA
ncbi:pleiotropic regulatory protein RsmS [Vibrio ordalii]|uniref:pleiotropic regulatory protein RsmS n=1 Tax=Vibrio ordalii TaxID=28174 RepID=UPI000248300B|nr:pleiotropic regulatory protein RsmS [Vibrio ordalii]